MLRGMTGLPMGEFIRDVYLNVLCVTAVAVVLPAVSAGLMPGGFRGFLMSVCVCVASAGLSVLFVGCSRGERNNIWSFVRNGGKL